MWILLLLLLFITPAHADIGISSSHYVDVKQRGLDCSHTTDMTSRFQALLDDTSFSAIFIPSGCKLLLAGPSASGTALTWNNNKDIICADSTSGFWLASKSCDSGRYQGSWCTANSDCRHYGATTNTEVCAIDGGLSTTFAPSGGSTYTALRIPSGAIDGTIKRCSFFTNGLSKFNQCNAGNTNAGKPCFQYCLGGANDGLACKDSGDCGVGTCQNVDCTGGDGTCETAQTTMKSGPGKINVIDSADATKAHSVRIQEVTVYDLAQSATAIAVPARSTIDGLRFDCTRALTSTNAGYPLCFPGINLSGSIVLPTTPTVAIDTGVSLGADAVIRNSGVFASTTGVSMSNNSKVQNVQVPVTWTAPYYTGLAAFPNPTTGISGGTNTGLEIRNSTITGATTGILADDNSIISDCVITGGTNGINGAAGQNMQVKGNTVTATNAIDVANFSNVQSNNVTGGTSGNGVNTGYGIKINDVVGINNSGSNVDSNIITGLGVGAAGIVLPNALNRVSNNYISSWVCVRGDGPGGINNTVIGNTMFSGAGPKITMWGAGWRVTNNYIAWTSGDGGYCAAGTTGGRLDQPCTVADGTTSDSTHAGCPSSTCTPAPVIAMGSPDHGKACSDYNGGTDHSIIAENELHTFPVSGPNIKFMDPGKSCDGGSRVSKYCTTDDTNASTGCPGATCPNCCDAPHHAADEISNNTILSGTYGIDFSALSSTNVGSKIIVVGNMFYTNITTAGILFPSSTSVLSGFAAYVNNFLITPFSGWNWKFGQVFNNNGVLSSDDTPQYSVMRSTETVVQGDLVEGDTSTDNGFNKADTSTTQAIGINLDGTASGSDGLVATRGTTFCNITGSVSKGDRLVPSATTAGRVKARASQSEQIIGVALTTNTTSSTTGCPGGVACVRCLILIVPSAAIITHTMSWYFPGLPVAGDQKPVGTLPINMTGCTLSGATMSMGTVANNATTWNIKRCTANCDGSSAATFTSMWSSDNSLTNDKYQKVTNTGLSTTNSVCTSSTACPFTSDPTGSQSDQFKVAFPTVGASTADYTVTMTFTCDQ